MHQMTPLCLLHGTYCVRNSSCKYKHGWVQIRDLEPLARVPFLTRETYRLHTEETFPAKKKWLYFISLESLNVCNEIFQPITVAARSKTWTVFARPYAGIAGTNPTQVMDICVRLFYVCVVLCVGSGLATSWSPVQGVLPTVYGLRNWKRGHGPTNGL
jgi:hypothetical protein